MNHLNALSNSVEYDDGDYTLSNKSDLFAYIILFIKNLIAENGRAGLIISNSWLGADWGRAFRQEIEKHFLIEVVVLSGKGRWFDNADVVTTILVLKKEIPPVRETTFITTSKKLSEWTEGDIAQAITETLVTTVNVNPIIQKVKYNQSELDCIGEVLVGWSSLFTNVLWVKDIKDKIIKVSSLFEVSRGERRGWNEMFYPEDSHGIEGEYIKPVLKSSASISGYLAASEGDAFCCSESLDDLATGQKLGALAWIRKFENRTNTDGKILPEVLARAGHYWYEMKDTALADLVLSMNPDKRIFIAKMEARGFVDQRLIRFTKVAEDIDVDLCHALLNSILGLFFIESSGFGRGLGALDLSATKLSGGLNMLNPNLLRQDDVIKIKALFLVVCSRDVKDLINELGSDDRIQFDKQVFETFGLSVSLYESVKSSLLRLYSIRQAVKE